MDPSLMKGFVGVDVPDPRDHGLIEQGDLDGPGGASQGGCNLSRPKGGGFGTQSTEESRFQVVRVLCEMKTSESSGIDEPQTDSSGFPTLEDPGRMSVCRDGTPLRWDLQPARHPESNHRGGPIPESQHELFSPAIDRFER